MGGEGKWNLEASSTVRMKQWVPCGLTIIAHFIKNYWDKLHSLALGKSKGLYRLDFWNFSCNPPWPPPCPWGSSSIPVSINRLLNPFDILVISSPAISHNSGQSLLLLLSTLLLLYNFCYSLICLIYCFIMLQNYLTIQGDRMLSNSTISIKALRAKE